MSRANPPTEATLRDLETSAKAHQAQADDLQRRAAREQRIANGYCKAAQRVKRALAGKTP